MRNQQDKYVVGYIKIRVKGKGIEVLLQTIKNRDIPIWNVEKRDEQAVDVMIYTRNLKEFKEIGESLNIIVEVMDKKGIYPSIQMFFENKVTLFIIAISMMIIFLLSNIIWKVEIQGASVDIDKEIGDMLEKEGLYEGAWMMNKLDLNHIQQKLLQSIPSLQYISINKRGTIFHINAVEKKIENKAEEHSARHLVASKDGVITKLFVKQGKSEVVVNDKVNKGDLLISGIISDEKDGESEDETNTMIVPAEGKVFANTWYELSVTIPITQVYDDLTGKHYSKFYLQWGHVKIPIWGWKQPFEQYVAKETIKTFSLFHYEFPVHISEQVYYESTTISKAKEQKELQNPTIEYLLKELKRKFGTDTEMKSYKILHESVDNGKVKMNLYVSVVEDITKTKPIRKKD